MPDNAVQPQTKSTVSAMSGRSLLQWKLFSLRCASAEVAPVTVQGSITSAVNVTNSKFFELKSLKTPTNLGACGPKIANISAASYAHPFAGLTRKMNAISQR
jgi:hypothetical protein